MALAPLLTLPHPQDSLLASPIILDLAILTELCQRISFCTESDPDFQGFHSVLSILGFLCKAPLVPEGSPVVNALFRQRSCIENILRYPWLCPPTLCPRPLLQLSADCRSPRAGSPLSPPHFQCQLPLPTQVPRALGGAWWGWGKLH